jgi:hypothetical protein
VWRLAFINLFAACFVGSFLAGILFATVQRNDTGFAARWDGACGGWTQEACLLHMGADLLTWCVYVAIALAVAKFHPIMDRIRSARTTVTLICCVFVSCGSTHLFEAWSVVYPAYWLTGVIKIVAAVLGLVGCVFIAHDLAAVRGVVSNERRLLEKHIAKLKTRK